MSVYYLNLQLSIEIEASKLCVFFTQSYIHFLDNFHSSCHNFFTCTFDPRILDRLVRRSACTHEVRSRVNASRPTTESWEKGIGLTLMRFPNDRMGFRATSCDSGWHRASTCTLTLLSQCSRTDVQPSMSFSRIQISLPVVRTFQTNGLEQRVLERFPVSLSVARLFLKLVMHFVFVHIAHRPIAFRLGGMIEN